MNQFSERYKALSTVELIKVIENKVDYKPEAVEAATLEINRRNLSDEAWSDAKRELEADKRETLKRQQKNKEGHRKVNAIAHSIFEKINPIQMGIPTPERQVSIISLILGCTAIYKWYKSFPFIVFMFTKNSVNWDFSMVTYFFPLVLLSAATILFLMRRKLGWILMTTYMMYALTLSFILTIVLWNEPTEFFHFDQLMPQITYADRILSVLYYGGVLWVLIKKEIRELFDISLQVVLLTMAIAVVLSAFLNLI